MPSPEILPFDTLFAPVSDDAPAGDDPRTSSALRAAFDKLADAFNAAEAQEKQEAEAAASADPGARSSPARTWGPVITPAIELLSRKTKDLEVANWLAQALVRVHGVAGLRDGLRLFQGLTEHFWSSGLHPQPEPPEDGEEAEDDDRLLFIKRIERQSALIALRLAPITGPKSTPFTHDDYVRANRPPGDEAAQARITLAANESGADYYVPLLEDFTAALGYMDGLENWLIENSLNNGLLLGKLRENLEEIRGAVRDISQDVVPQVAEDADAQAAGPGGGGSGGGSAGSGFRASGTNALQDREAALRSLEEIARFFKTTEPHSPIGYTLESLVERARMPLHKLLEDLMPDDNTRQAFLNKAGIRIPPSD